jgi:GTP pyrophosphokinase
LQNSQTVEIVTARGAKPNPNWVTFVTTAKARTAIQKYMKNMRSSESVDLGKRLLDRSLKDLGSSLRKVGKVRLREALDELAIEDATALYGQLGLGERLAPLTARFLIGETEDSSEPASASLVIAGTEGIVVSYAKCCYPIPGDDVMGYLSSGRGVVIHRNSCGNLIHFRKQPEKWLTVSWEDDIDREFSSQVLVETVNKTGVLAEVAAVIADSESNIEEVAVNNRHQDISSMTFLLQVKNRVHLARIMRNVRKMANVIRVNRDNA